MACTDVHKVLFKPHMLVEEFEHWWENTWQRLEVVGTSSIWSSFKKECLDKYFPADVHNCKEIKFLEMKQGNMSLDDYATRVWKDI